VEEDVEVLHRGRRIVRAPRLSRLPLLRRRRIITRAAEVEELLRAVEEEVRVVEGEGVQVVGVVVVAAVVQAGRLEFIRRPRYEHSCILSHGVSFNRGYISSKCP
jgi:hypothetical protein